MSTLKTAIEKHFDYGYLLEMLHWKLRKMQHFFESDNAVYIDSLKISQEIKLVADALQRYLDDNYCDEWYQILYAHCGDIQIKLIHEKDNLDVYKFQEFFFENCNNQERALRIWRKLNQRAHDLRQRDFEFVFDTLKEKLQNWWD